MCADKRRTNSYKSIEFAQTIRHRVWPLLSYIPSSIAPVFHWWSAEHCPVIYHWQTSLFILRRTRSQTSPVLGEKQCTCRSFYSMLQVLTICDDASMTEDHTALIISPKINCRSRQIKDVKWEWNYRPLSFAWMDFIVLKVHYQSKQYTLASSGHRP